MAQGRADCNCGAPGGGNCRRDRWPRSARRRLALTLSSRRMERGQRPRLQGARQFPPIARHESVGVVARDKWPALAGP